MFLRVQMYPHGNTFYVYAQFFKNFRYNRSIMNRIFSQFAEVYLKKVIDNTDNLKMLASVR